MRHIDQATCAVGEVLARDRASLAMMRDLRVLLVDVIQALEGEPVSHEAVEVLAAADARLLLPER